VNGGFGFVEAAFADDFQGQISLPHPGRVFAQAAAALFGQQLLALFRGQ
jgi:hypothetical protein